MTTITSLRQSIDSYINSIQFLRNTREVALAKTNLQRSFMWLGESLKSTGSTSPYVNSENPSNKTIEPTADHAEENLLDRWDLLETTHTARVKDFRFVLEEKIKEFNEMRKQSESYGKEYDSCLDQSFNALKESKMWLGWELARIKKELEGSDANAPESFLPL